MAKTLPTVGFPAEVLHKDREGNIVLNTVVYDQSDPTLAVPFLKTRAQITLASPATLDQNIINLEPGHGVTAGEIIELAVAGSNIFMQSGVVSVSVNEITLDCPVNYPYSVTDDAFASSNDLLVDGSVTPQIFSILPGPTQSGHIVRLITEIRGTGNMDFSTFGSDDELTNGCIVRIKQADGNFKNLFNFKSNADLILQGYDNAFMLPAQGNTTKGFTSRITYGGQSKHGVVIRLDGSLGEELQLVIQDDLTSGDNTDFRLIGQGHEI